MLKTISDQSFSSLKNKGWKVTANSRGFVCCKNGELAGPAFGSAQEAWVYAEAAENAVAIKVATKAQANADVGRVIDLRAKLEMLQDDLAEAEKKADASKRYARALMTEAADREYKAHCKTIAE